MTGALTADDAFLGVTQSATGRLWRDRLDARGAAQALAIAQRYDLPEMLARIIAGRNIAVDAVGDFLDPTIRKLMPDPYTLTDMETAAGRIADAVTKREAADAKELRRLCLIAVRTLERLLDQAALHGSEVNTLGRQDVWTRARSR